MSLVDDVTIKVKAGNGGDGGKSFHTNYGSKNPHTDGGNGGRGGDIYFEGSANVHDLNEFRFKKLIKAPDGERGMNKNLDGRGGEDITVLVPLGTTIIDTANEKAVELLEEKVPVRIARGGKGQIGNHDRSEETFAMRKYNLFHQKGEEKELHLVLSLIADIGLIGFPNAGKSSLLKTLTNAVPKIGNYPFTTLEPNLGTISTKTKNGKNKIVLADIPGLVEGASVGKGLGIQFLKHIQKTKMLLHCIDATTPDVYEAYKTVREEFEGYDKSLLLKKEIILLTKCDLLTDEELKKQIKTLSKTKKEILPVSIYDDVSMTRLSELLKKEV